MPNSEKESANTVRMLWHGSPLSLFEDLSLLSFVRCGHDVEIYSYDDLKVPDGVKLCDANEILAENDVFCYTDGLAKGSFSAFSNLFRFKMLFEKGGIWSDPDVLCLRPLHALPDASVGRVGSKNFFNGAVVKFARGNSICGELYAQTKALDQNILLGQTGGLIMQAVERHPSSFNVLPSSAFYPLTWHQTWMLLDPGQAENCETLAASSYCVHWWNTAITMEIGLPKDALPPEGSFLYRAAERVFGHKNFSAWPQDTARIWIDNYKLAKTYTERKHLLERPVTALLKSSAETVSADLRDLMRGVGRRLGRKR
jgi:hypothetical protein